MSFREESGAEDFDLTTPCPVCSGTLVSIRNKDGTPFMGVTGYLIFCKKCDFEEDAKKWQERLDDEKM
jgi:C4-type Zn-finger protein